MNQNRIFWGLLLICSGIIFALVNLGVIHINLWDIFFPSLMIIVGGWILFKSFWRRKLTSETIEVPLDNVQKADIRIDFGAGKLHVCEGTNPSLCIEAHCEGTAKLEMQKSEQKIEAHLKMESGDLPVIQPNDYFKWDVRLNQQIPLRVEIHSGASDNEYDFRKMQITDLRIESGASNTMVYLPEAAGETRASMKAGAASLSIIIPQDVSARIRVQGALSSVSVDQKRFPRTGDYYQSVDFEASNNRIYLEAEIGVGSIEIR